MRVQRRYKRFKSDDDNTLIEYVHVTKFHYTIQRMDENNVLTIEIVSTCNGEQRDPGVTIDVFCGQADIGALIKESRHIPFIFNW